jgi:hypothetical protein
MSARLGFESLEGRLMMAGNVAVSVTGGDLVLTGDNAGNLLEIRQVQLNDAPIPGRFLVTGVNGTTINGQNSQVFQNVTDDVRINLNGGNDRVTLGQGTTVESFQVPDDLEINTGNGSDVVILDRITAGDDATLRTGAGADFVNVKAVVGRAGVDFGANDLTIDTGANYDYVRMENTTVRRNVTVNTGIDNFTDVVDMLFSEIGNDTNLNTGAGNDVVNIFNVRFNDDLTVNTGTGQDDVDIDQSTVDELSVNLGGDSDSLELTNSVGRRATLNGGLGANFLTQADNDFDSFQAFGF